MRKQKIQLYETDIYNDACAKNQALEVIERRSYFYTARCMKLGSRLNQTRHAKNESVANSSRYEISILIGRYSWDPV